MAAVSRAPPPPLTCLDSAAFRTPLATPVAAASPMAASPGAVVNAPFPSFAAFSQRPPASPFFPAPLVQDVECQRHYAQAAPQSPSAKLSRPSTRISSSVIVLSSASSAPVQGLVLRRRTLDPGASPRVVQMMGLSPIATQRLSQPRVLSTVVSPQAAYTQPYSLGSLTLRGFPPPSPASSSGLASSPVGSQAAVLTQGASSSASPVPPLPEPVASSSTATLTEQQSPDASGSATEEIMVLNPLAIRFSQPRINPLFTDGSLLDSAVSACGLAQCRTGALTPGEHLELSFLRAPFPPIEVVRFRPKLRRPDGTALKDEVTGEPVWGQERWFTMDNRRLYCLQRAALELWPKPCFAEVRVISAVCGERKVLGKFRTTDEGLTIVLAFAKDAEVDRTAWDWRAALKNRGDKPAGIDGPWGAIEAEEQLDEPGRAWVAQSGSLAPTAAGKKPAGPDPAGKASAKALARAAHVTAASTRTGKGSHKGEANAGNQRPHGAQAKAWPSKAAWHNQNAWPSSYPAHANVNGTQWSQSGYTGPVGGSAWTMQDSWHGYADGARQWAGESQGQQCYTGGTGCWASEVSQPAGRRHRISTGRA